MNLCKVSPKSFAQDVCEDRLADIRVRAVELQHAQLGPERRAYVLHRSVVSEKEKASTVPVAQRFGNEISNVNQVV